MNEQTIPSSYIGGVTRSKQENPYDLTVDQNYIVTIWNTTNMQNYAKRMIPNYRNITEIPKGHLPEDLDPYGYEDNWSWAFANMYNLQSLPEPFYNISGATNMYGMFYSTNLRNIKSFNIPDTCTDCGSMFCMTGLPFAPKLPSNVKNTMGMFERCNLDKMYDEFPDSIEDMNSMFDDNINMTGTIPPLPPKVTNIGFTFNWCSNLTGNIPDLTNITNVWSSFNNCSNLKGTIVLNDGVRRLQESFRNCRNIEFLNIDHWPPNVYSMIEAFQNCTNMKGTIPDMSNLPIDSANRSYSHGIDAAFENCSNLTGTIPNLPQNCPGMRIDYAFAGCCNLTGNIPKIPNSIKSMTGTFSNCYNITGNLPDLSEVTDIVSLYSAFSNCRNLTGTLYNLNIPDNTNIRNIYSAFSNCRNLTGDIPKWIQIISNSQERMGLSFSNCTNLSGFEDASSLHITSRTISGAFYNCYNLQNSPCELTFTDGSRAFYNCTNIKGNFPELSVYYKPNDDAWHTEPEIYMMFYNCQNITGTLPNIDANIIRMDNAFCNCVNVSNSNVYVYADNMSYSNISGCYDNIPATINIYCHANTDTYNAFANYVNESNNIGSNGPRYLYIF